MTKQVTGQYIDSSSLLFFCFFLSPFPGIDDDDSGAGESETAAAEEMPPLEGDDDASRMEEVDQLFILWFYFYNLIPMLIEET